MKATFYYWNASLSFNRSELHTLLWEYIQELGIRVDFSAAVDDHFETNDEASVVLADGQKLTADIVVAADGVGSKSWSMVLGEKDVTISSEFACYRANFQAGEALKNPIIAKEFENQPDRASIHIGPGAHMAVGKTERQMCYILKHRVCFFYYKLHTYAIWILTNSKYRTITTQKRTGTKPYLQTKPCSTYKAGMLSWSSSSKQLRKTAAPTGNCSGTIPNRSGLLLVPELSNLATPHTLSYRPRGAGQQWPWRMRILWQRACSWVESRISH